MTPTEHLIEDCLFWLKQELSAYEIIQKIENNGNYAYTDLTADQIYDICQYFYMHHLSPDSVAADCYPKVGYPESYAYHCELLGEKPPIVGMNAGILCCANCQYLIENDGYYDCGNIANLSNSHDNLIHLGFVASGSEFLTHLGCLDFVKKSEN